MRLSPLLLSSNFPPLCPPRTCHWYSCSPSCTSVLISLLFSGPSIGHGTCVPPLVCLYWCCFLGPQGYMILIFTPIMHRCKYRHHLLAPSIRGTYSFSLVCFCCFLDPLGCDRCSPSLLILMCLTLFTWRIHFHLHLASLLQCSLVNI